MPPENNPNQFSLESQRETLKFQETLENLDITIAKLNASQEALNTGAKLDELIDVLVNKYGEDRSKINWEFDKASTNINMANQQSYADNINKEYQDIVSLQQQRQAVESSLSRYNSPLPMAASEATMMSDALAAGQMKNQTQGVLDNGYFEPLAAGYYGEGLKNPYFRNNIDIFGSSGQALSPMEYQLADQFQVNKIAENQDPTETRKYLDYQRDMYAESQKVMYNKHLSSALGMEGMTSRGDFEAISSPALTGLAEDMGIAVDEAAGIVKRLKDLRVITQDISSGSGVEVLNAVDNTANILTSVSKLIGSTDIQQLVATSSQLSSIGGGSFLTGLKTVKQDTAAILGPFSDPQYSISQAAAMGEHYSSMFGGNNKSSVNMGAWDFRTRNLLQTYATDDFFNYAGGPEQAAQVYMPHLAKRATGMQALIRSSGKGYDLLSGAGKLSGEAGEDPLSFYMNMPRNIKKASETMSGIGAETNLSKEIELYQKQYGFSEDEAMLAVFGGDPTAVDAYKEVRSAKDAFASEYEDKVHLARFNSVFKPSRGFSVTRVSDVEDLTDVSNVLDEVGNSRIGQMGYDLGENLFGDNLSGSLEFTSGGMASYEGLSRIKEQRRELVAQNTAVTSRLEKGDVAALAHIPGIINTDAAATAVEETVTRIASMKGSFKFDDIRYILTKGLQEYVYSGLIGKDTSAMIGNYIAKLTPAKALHQIGKIVDKSSSFYKLLLIGVDPSKSSQLLSTVEEFSRANLAGALKESGMSVDDIQGLVGSSDDSLLRGASDLINNNLIGSSLVSGGATALATAGVAAAGLALGFTVGLPGAAIATGIGLIAPGALSAGVRSVGGGIDYAKTVIGNRIDIDDVVGELGSGTVSTLQSEIRYMISFTRAFADYMLFNNGEQLTELLSLAVNVYAQTYQDYLSKRGEDIKPEKRPPLPEGSLESAINLLASSVDSKVKDPDNVKITKVQWARGVLRFINTKTNEMGKSLREGNPIQKAVTMRRTIEAEAEEVSTGMFAGMTGQGSLINLFDREEVIKNVDRVGTALTSQTRDSADIEQQFTNVSSLIGRKAETAEAADSARNVIATIRNAQEAKDYSGLKELSEEDLLRSEKTLGKNFVNELRGIMSEEDDTKKRRRLAPLMASKASEAGSMIEKDALEGRKVANMFMELTRRMQIDSEMQQNVMLLGKLLNGESI